MAGTRPLLYPATDLSWQVRIGNLSAADVTALSNRLSIRRRLFSRVGAAA